MRVRPLRTLRSLRNEDEENQRFDSHCQAGERNCKLGCGPRPHVASGLFQTRELMQSSAYVSRHLPLLIILAGSGAAAGTGIWLLLRGRRKKSDAEKERDRRLAVNAVGRMTDGTLTETPFPNDTATPLLLCYRYRVSGVEYSSAQDVSDLHAAMNQRAYLPGENVIIKYDPHNPSNSIVVCELWTGLSAGDRQPQTRRRGNASLTGS